MLTQLYQNLISNALKFIKDKAPEIHLTAQSADDRWILGVRDNGIGMKPEYAERIFQPFQRLHSRGEYQGTGIGLSICKKTVQRHAGEIWVESEQGEGAHFQFSLPVTEPKSAAAVFANADLPHLESASLATC
jgi:light-regulated signal transduction histidine kinase (bacteriophytochrome)